MIGKLYNLELNFKVLQGNYQETKKKTYTHKMGENSNHTSEKKHVP